MNIEQTSSLRLLNFSDPESVTKDRSSTDSSESIVKSALAYFRTISNTDTVDLSIAIKVTKEMFVAGEFPLSEIVKSVEGISEIQVSTYIPGMIKEWLVERQDGHGGSKAVATQSKIVDWEQHARGMQADFSGAFQRINMTADTVALEVSSMIHSVDPREKKDGISLYLKLTGIEKMHEIVAEKYKADAREFAKATGREFEKSQKKDSDNHLHDKAASSAYRKRMLEIETKKAVAMAAAEEVSVVDAKVELPVKENENGRTGHEGTQRSVVPEHKNAGGEKRREPDRKSSHRRKEILDISMDEETESRKGRFSLAVVPAHGRSVGRTFVNGRELDG